MTPLRDAALFFHGPPATAPNVFKSLGEPSLRNFESPRAHNTVRSCATASQDKQGHAIYVFQLSGQVIRSVLVPWALFFMDHNAVEPAPLNVRLEHADGCTVRTCKTQETVYEMQSWEEETGNGMYCLLLGRDSAAQAMTYHGGLPQVDRNKGIH